MVGHTSAFFLFPAPAGPGFPYSPYSGRKSRARVRVLLDRADHCGQVDVQHAAARGRNAAARPERCAWSGCSRSSHPARMPWIGCGCHWRRSYDWRKTHAQRSCATGDEQPAAAVRALARSATSAGRSRGPTMPPRCARAPATEYWRVFRHRAFSCAHTADPPHCVCYYLLTT